MELFFDIETELRWTELFLIELFWHLTLRNKQTNEQTNKQTNRQTNKLFLSNANNL